MASSHLNYALPAPSVDQAYVKVSALEAGIIHLPLQFFVKGASPSEVSVCPSLAFYIRHIPSGDSMVFDLGLRRDVASYPKVVQDHIARLMPVTVPQSVEESLAKGGVDPKSVQRVVLSHLHFDHIGDAAQFPNARFTVGAGGRELLQPQAAFPHNQSSDILQSTVPLDRTDFLEESQFNVSIGPFTHAYDYFGDGSLYIIDAVGHLKGHINILARTSSIGSWIYLGGDTAHDVRLLTGEKEVAFMMDAGGMMLCAHANKDEAVEHIRRVGSLLNVPKVHVLLAHDWEWYEENKGGEAFLPGTISPM
ncbi:Metallo-hydrolase/oxidoreductase [Dichomitus squalens]|uniref:Metallo-hydrolase/oxidoreductase n=1 Tax=Dichomitus squalens TaxID=114155 RepID=A0A4Q9MTS1_9APHY|nr:Metallo-hydrolase/oxidoreductase [Dichomitus squalens]